MDEPKESRRAGLAPRDTWPDLRVTLHLLPWTWPFKPWLYRDDVEGALGHSSFQWLFLDVQWWGNRPMFRDVGEKETFDV